jgi:hypothetical protein
MQVLLPVLLDVGGVNVHQINQPFGARKGQGVGGEFQKVDTHELSAFEDLQFKKRSVPFPHMLVTYAG